jgi:hypothetical protein
MERGVSLLDFSTVDSMVQVHGVWSYLAYLFINSDRYSVDYSGISLMGGRTPNSKAAAKIASQIFNDYYPELLVCKFAPASQDHANRTQHRKLFVSVPVFLTWIFWTFTTLLSPATQRKMSVVGSGPATISAALLPIIDEAELPKRYGGTGEDI